MKKVLLFSLLMSAIIDPASAQSDDDDDRPVIRKDRSSSSQPKAIWAINPMHVTEDNVGFAVSYEHYLDDKGIVSLYLPLSYSLPQYVHDYKNEHSYYGNGYYNPSDLQYSFNYSGGMVNFYPGIKIYPGGAHKKVSYAIGSSFLFGFGSTRQITVNYRIDTTYSGNYPSYSRVYDNEKVANVSRFKMGMLINNSLNIIAAKKYYFGLEFGFGYSYFSMIDGMDADRTGLVQFGAKLGLVK
jgi:hypothetical protein